MYQKKKKINGTEFQTVGIAEFQIVGTAEILNGMIFHQDTHQEIHFQTLATFQDLKNGKLETFLKDVNDVTQDIKIYKNE